MDYNEVILDGLHWNKNLPHAIEAFFGTGDLAKHQHEMFLKEFGLTAEQAPLCPRCLPAKALPEPKEQSTATSHAMYQHISALSY